MEMTSTVAEVIRRSARRWPTRIALHFGERRWTYEELDDGVSRVAGRLLELGLAKGERVAALGTNSDAYLLLYLGCARAGLVHVPVNYNLVGGELAYIIIQSGSTALFADPALQPAVDAIAERPSHRHAARRRRPADRRPGLGAHRRGP
jgi:fatty-acyl-CoA synthase